MANPLLAAQTPTLAGLLSTDSLPVNGARTRPQQQKEAANVQVDATRSDAAVVEFSSEALQASQASVSLQAQELTEQVNGSGESADVNLQRPDINATQERVTFTINEDGAVQAEVVEGSKVVKTMPTPGALGTGDFAPTIDAVTQTDLSDQIGLSIDLSA